ncbi:MAG: hypothetical protein ABII63_01405 [Pseudomonadota bacterium]
MSINRHRVRKQQQTSSSMARSSHIEQYQPRRNQRISANLASNLLAVAQFQDNVSVFAVHKRNA